MGGDFLGGGGDAQEHHTGILTQDYGINSFCHGGVYCAP